MQLPYLYLFFETTYEKLFKVKLDIDRENLEQKIKLQGFPTEIGNLLNLRKHFFKKLIYVCAFCT